MFNNLSHYKVTSTFDLQNAYHQVPMVKDDRKYTGFEANGRLYQFQRIPLGVTNGQHYQRGKTQRLIPVS